MGETGAYAHLIGLLGRDFLSIMKMVYDGPRGTVSLTPDPTKFTILNG